MKVIDTRYGEMSPAEFLSNIEAAHRIGKDTDLIGPIEVIEIESLLTATNAPPEYDGFGTTTIATGNDGWRLVETPVRHTEWQRQRYRSGMHRAVAFDKVEA